MIALLRTYITYLWNQFVRKNVRYIARNRVPAPDGAELDILDECKSVLDVEDEGKVMDAIRVNGQGNAMKTTLHKISVMQLCDRIIVLDQGSVNDEGMFDSESGI